MSKFTNSLNNIKIASPCSADWNAMIGDERRRFCGDCKLNVYNLSGMSKREAENLILQAENRLCVRFYRRADGSVLTKDCPVGWRALKKRISKTATAFASLAFTALSGIGLVNYFAKSNEQHVMGKMSPRVERFNMGEIAVKEANSNVAVQEEPIAKMGEFSIKDDPTEGMISNVEQVKRKISIRRNR